MKVLKNAGPDKWWVGVTVLCKYCQANLELEDGDDVSLGDYQGTLIARFDCPECKMPLSVLNFFGLNYNLSLKHKPSTDAEFAQAVADLRKHMAAEFPNVYPVNQIANY